jgi:hypothetical protein
VCLYMCALVVSRGLCWHQGHPLDRLMAAFTTVRYAGDAAGKGGIYNFVTKRGLCSGSASKISWTQVCAFDTHFS